MSYCYFNGEVVKESAASISIHNIGVHRSFGIFDLFRGRSGKPTFMEDHLERFDRSQQFLGLSRLISKDEIRQAVSDLQAKNRFSESTFRIMLMGDGSEQEEAFSPLFYIINSNYAHHENPSTAHIILHEYLRDYPKVKSLNYMTSLLLHQQKAAYNAVDVVYHHQGMVSEASRSNVFIVKDGVILTPENHILEGITRKHVLSFASEVAEVRIQDISVDDFSEADEIFITSTIKEVMPIIRIADNKVGDGQVGSVTKQLQARFIDHLH